MRTQKVDLPVHVRSAMSYWERGFTSLPQSYVEFHQALAEEELARMEADEAVIVHRKWMKPDGWGDGMEHLNAVIEKDDKLFKVYWHDRNQEFFQVSETGGAYPLRFGTLK